MQKQVKKIAELFGCKNYKEIYKVKGITIIPKYGEHDLCDFERIEVKFRTQKQGDKDVECFVLCVDKEYYLKHKASGKGLSFQKGEEKAIHFLKDGEKKTYQSILRRAGEALALVLEGAFEKEIDIGDE